MPEVRLLVEAAGREAQGVSRMQGQAREIVGVRFKNRCASRDVFRYSVKLFRIREWGKAHREHLRAYRKRYYKDNIQKVRAQARKGMKKYRERNLEKERERGRDYYKRSPSRRAKVAKMSKAWRAKNKDRCNRNRETWAAKNPERLRESSRRHQAKRRENGSARDYLQRNKERILEWSRGYRVKNKERLRDYFRGYRASKKEARFAEALEAFKKALET